MMTHWQQRMTEDLQLRGMSRKTQESYVRAVRILAERCGKSPDEITEEELRQHFLYLMNIRKYSRAASTIALCGIKFFYEHTAKRDWPTIRFVRARREKKLPVVLTVEEVRSILSRVRLPRYRVCLTTIYSCGLRLGEGMGLQVPDIDGKRMLIHVRSAKGNKDRYVPLPESTLLGLRRFWVTHRNPVWLFPSPGRGGVGMSSATEPLSRTSVQAAFRAALQDSGVHKRASVHTLRHSYATHLLENGVNLRQIQEYLGHNSPLTTAIYTHLTQTGQRQAAEAINRLMQNL